MSIKKIALGLTGSLVLAGALSVIGDFYLAWRGIDVSLPGFVLAIILLTGVFFLASKKNPMGIVKTAAAVVGVLCAAVIGLFLCWHSFRDDAAFAAVDDGKQQLYADKRVMLIVPHQDDDLLVLGGVIEEIVRYGSDMYPVFVTNGDADGLAEVRFQEALSVFSSLGVPSENVIFLGYGDRWMEGGPHLYNASPEEIMTSAYGRTATYGTASHGVYREGREYTRTNFLQDMEDLILQIRPNMIVCSDYDDHIDHKAISLTFEKVMGKILKENPDYRPLVFKGYAYSTAWHAEADFYEQNLKSTQNAFEEPYCQKPAVYSWEDRVRLPVGDYTLSRSLFSADTFYTLSLYASQNPQFRATRVINGDKVVWYRSTDSLCLNAQIVVDSGNGEVLNDFMLLENENLIDETHMPYDGVWIPTDEEKTATVVFQNPVDVGQITLYDNPSAEDNVQAGVICFDDGSEVAFGPLKTGGAATDVPVNKTNVRSFSVTLTKVDGESAGLTEIEAFQTAPGHGLRFVKMMDEEENFIYDYWVEAGKEVCLSVYAPELSWEELNDLKVSWDDEKCWAKQENGKITVCCPAGRSMTLTLSLEESGISDTVRIQNPGKLRRLQFAVGQTLEENVYQKYIDGAHYNTATYKMLMMLYTLIS